MRGAIEATPSLNTVPSVVNSLKNEGNQDRNGKFLRIHLKRENIKQGNVFSSNERSEALNVPIRYTAPSIHTEYSTKTVLITKLEKFTDRRVTATLLAINCLPVDHNIPMCRSIPSHIPNPINETPDEYLRGTQLPNWDGQNTQGASSRLDQYPTLGGNVENSYNSSAENFPYVESEAINSGDLGEKVASEFEAVNATTGKLS